MSEDPLLAAIRSHERDRETSRYERLEELGRGGFAIVYRARDRKLNRDVALKVLRDDVKLDGENLTRFRREAEAAARLSHANIVTVLDAGEDGGHMYIAMELVRGESFNKLLATRRSDLRLLVTLLEKVARAVQHAHERGIVHRDLKPSNVLITPQGEPKVADFGLAHVSGRETALTRDGMLLGTPLYMAPEQAAGRVGAITPRTDVYAMGAMLYEMLAGRPPHVADTALEICRRIVDEDPVTPRRLNARVSRDLETVALVALDKDQRRRYATAGAFADDLRRWLAGEPIQARPAGAVPRLLKWVRRHPTRSSVAALLALGALVAGLLRADSAMRDARARAQARAEAKRAADAKEWDAAAKAWTRLESLGEAGAGRQAAEAARRADEAREELRAESMAAQARAAEDEYDQLTARKAELRRLIAEEGARVKPFDPPEKKAAAWAMIQELDGIEPRQAALEARVMSLWSSSLMSVRRREHAARLARFLWSRMEDAEREDVLDARGRVKYFQELIGGLASEHDLKDVAARLVAGGTVDLTYDPPGAADAFVFRYEEASDLRLMPLAYSVATGGKRPPERWETADTGYALECSDFNRLPAGAVTLPVGSYLLLLHRPGFRDTRYPVLVERESVWRENVRLCRDEEIGKDFVYVPGGPFFVSRERKQLIKDMETRASLPGFFIGRFEVTCDEYVVFLNDRSHHSLEQAWARTPRRLATGAHLWSKRDDSIVFDSVWRGYAVVAISPDDAEEYCAWRTARESGWGYRLPSLAEWQKAGRGVDGRLCPWGWQFDFTFARGGMSSPEIELGTVGEFLKDESPYGVRDMSGSVSELLADGPSNSTRYVAGGSFLTKDQDLMRIGAFHASDMRYVEPHTGLRVVRYPR